MTYDLVIRGGTVATACDTFRADVGIRYGRVAALAEGLEGADVIEASGKLVLPGGIEAHCHIAQESGMGLMSADDYETGSISAAFGGNSSFVPFAAQSRGTTIRETVETYDRRAAPKSVIDYSYHLIVTDPTELALTRDLPEAFERGITSLKVFMTYPLSRIDDRQFLEILTCAKQHGALTMVHAENSEMIAWMTDRLIAAGHTEPRYHAPSRPAMAEEEAINRAITLARFVDAPLLIVHVSTPGGARLIREARAEGAKIFGETCPQYLFLTAADLDRPGKEGAKYVCSPPLRDAATQAMLWRQIQTGTLQLVSSDHAPYRLDSGKYTAGPDVGFDRIANGMPGIEMRLPLLFSEGVNKGRISLNQFVALSSTNAAKIYGMHPRKGTIAIGSDADIAIWDPDETRVAGAMHDAMDYNPFEGREVTGWPVTVLSRGRRVVDEGALLAKPGDGAFVACKPVDLTGMPGTRAPELDPATNFGARIAP